MFEKVLLGFEGSLPHIGWFNQYLVIPGIQVDLAEIFFPFDFVQKVINPIRYLFQTVILFNAR
jgi:hypothetical protein